MAEDKTGRSGQLPQAALVIALLATGYFIFEKPISSRRPAERGLRATAPSALQDADARLWEDPIDAARRHQIESCQPGSEAAPSTHEPAKLRASVRYFFRQQKGSLLVLPVLVDGGSYSEQAERRRRDRVAVLSALGASGLLPVDPEHVGYFRADGVWAGDSPGEPGANASDDRHSGSRRCETSLVAYEWFALERPTGTDRAFSNVIVLWIDQGLLSAEPNRKLQELVRGILIESSEPERVAHQLITLGRLSIALVGPASSNALREWINDLPSAPPVLTMTDREKQPTASCASATVNERERWSEQLLAVGRLYVDDGSALPQDTRSLTASLEKACLDADRQQAAAIALRETFPIEDSDPRWSDQVARIWAANRKPDDPTDLVESLVSDAHTHLGDGGFPASRREEIRKQLVEDLTHADIWDLERKIGDRLRRLCEEDDYHQWWQTIARIAASKAALDGAFAALVDEAKEAERGSGSRESRGLPFSMAATRPTASDESLMRTASTRAVTTDQTDAHHIEDSFRRSGVEFARATPRDSGLVAMIVAELAERGVNLCMESTPDGRAVAESNVVLVGEWDTLYGRDLVDLFKATAGSLDHCQSDFGTANVVDCLERRALARHEDPGRPRSVHGPTHQVSLMRATAGEADLELRGGVDDRCTSISVRHYLRGLDGEVGNAGDRDRKSNDRGAAVAQTAELGLSTRSEPPAEQAFGVRQLDSIRRIASAIDEIENVRAVGLFGTDVYDKLSMLQALRERNPDLLFFTTDMDARLIEPDALQYTHGLLVASGYGLELGSMQKNLPPFRDTYQTSTFRAVQKLLQQSMASQFREIAPRHRGFIYEIGTSGPELIGWSAAWPFPLGNRPRTGAEPGTRADRLALEPVAGSAVATNLRAPVSSPAHHASPHDRVVSRDTRLRTRHERTGKSYLSEVIPARDFRALHATVNDDGTHRQKLRFQITGASVLLAIAILVAGPAFWRLSQGSDRPHAGYGPSRWMQAAVSVSLAGLAGGSAFALLSRATSKPLVGSSREPFAWFNGVSAWPSALLWLFATALSVALLLRAWASLHEREWTIAERYLVHEAPRSPDSLREACGRFIRSRDSRNEEVDVKELWADYRRFGDFRWRLLRSLALLLSVLVAVVFLCKGLGFAQPLPLPVRGEDRVLVDFLRLAAYGSLGLVTCFVADSVMLTCSLARPLTIGEGNWLHPEGRTVDSAWRECRDIGFIARHSRAVCGLVFHPFLISVPILLANNRYFDHWDWPRPFIVLLAVYGALLLGCAHLLRRVAENGRESSLRSSADCSWTPSAHRLDISPSQPPPMPFSSPSTGSSAPRMVPSRPGRATPCCRRC